MDYFKSNARASAQALLVICRHLAKRPSGETIAGFQATLEPALLVKPHTPREGLLNPSLQIGQHLGILEQKGTLREQIWYLTDLVSHTTLVDLREHTNSFYSLVLRRICQCATVAATSGNQLSDVAVGLMWLCQQDPTRPWSKIWGDGPEAAIKGNKLVAAIGGQDQWRPFYRWATSLGLATDTKAGRQKSILPDATRAVRSVLAELPRKASAEQWIARVRELLPVLGHTQLLRLLPGFDEQSGAVGGALSLAIHKLEREGRLNVIPAPDAANVVALRLGSRLRPVSHIEVLEASA